MEVNPVYNSIGKFFHREPMYRIPKYQRSYAWEEPEIKDFLKDLENCFQKRKSGNPINHFFGGIVSVEKSVTGVVNQHEFELVDGQQRFATIVLLIASLIHKYEELEVSANSAGDTSNERIIQNRIEKLSERYIEYEQEINRQTEVIDVLILSHADKQFFKDILHQNNPGHTRESHLRIKYAYDEIVQKIDQLVTGATISDKLDDLEHIHLIVDTDFSLIHIVTKDHKEAYRLFQVLNDRGKSLTEGDLLRAKTLEILEGFTTQQDSIKTIWDDILKDPSKLTESYLRWIYASNKGMRAGRNTLFNDILDEFYPQHQNLPINNANADEILAKTRQLHAEIQIARRISQGLWPFSPTQRPVTQWDKSRLDLLIRELGLTVTLPILLSTYKLGERKFSKMVQVLERFLFRYKVIGNQHIEAAVSKFHDHAVNIRSDSANYNINTLISELQALQNARINDTLFKDNLENLNYKLGGGNKPIKYFLMTLEHYKRWFDDGASGEPTCRDKTRIYDFSSTTIEHVYPRNADVTLLDSTLEPHKNSLMNLTFMGPSDNVTGGNDNFITKKPIFESSSISLNKDIGNNTQWTQTELQLRNSKLKDMACKIFKI